MTDPALEAELILGYWTREAIRRARERLAAQQLGEAFSDLNLPLTLTPEEACVPV